MKRQWKKEIPRQKNYLMFGVFVGVVILCMFPTAIHPMLFPESYQKIQEEVRKNIKQEDVQPGNMRVWRDPFDRDKTKKELN